MVKVIPTEIPEVLLLEPRVFEDPRGMFFESYNRRTFARATGVDVEFVQDNFSRSVKNVIRGLHYQVEHPQGKLVRTLRGRIFDVAVDLRKSSPTFGSWVGFTLSEADRRMAWIPPGFAHGFLVLSEEADVHYKVTNYWYAEHERTIAWNDPDLAVGWPIEGEPAVQPTMTDKDRRGTPLASAELFE